jgi:hypothetical protein
MTRLEYCVRQAALCRDLAVQMSMNTDAMRLREMAARYDAEADILKTPPVPGIV